MKPDVDRHRIVGRTREGGGHGLELRLGSLELLPSFVKLGAQEVDSNGRALTRPDRVEEFRGVRLPAKEEKELGPREEPVLVRDLRKEGESLLSFTETGEDPRGPFAPLERLRQRPAMHRCGRRTPARPPSSPPTRGPARRGAVLRSPVPPRGPGERGRRPPPTGPSGPRHQGDGGPLRRRSPPPGQRGGRGGAEKDSVPEASRRERHESRSARVRSDSSRRRCSSRVKR